MPTVRCPSCRRALRLPENREVTTAQCPLCQATFDASSPAPPPPTPKAKRPTRQVAEPEDDDEPPEVKNARGAALGAAGWLKSAGMIGLAQLVFCSCVDVFDASARDASPNALRMTLAVMAGRFVVLIVVWSGGEAMARRRSLGHALIGAVLALVIGGYMAYRAWPPLRNLYGQLTGPQNRFDPYSFATVLLFVVFCLAVAVPAVVGSVWTFALSCRPSVRALFARQP